MSRRKKLINHTDIPQYQIEAIARCIMPDILAFYESEDIRHDTAGICRMEGTAGSGKAGGKNRIKMKRAGAPWKRLRPPFLNYFFL